MEKTIVVPKSFISEKLYIFKGEEFASCDIKSFMTIDRNTDTHKVDINFTNLM